MGSKRHPPETKKGLGMHGACKPAVLGGDWSIRLGELVGGIGDAKVNEALGFAWVCCVALLGPLLAELGEEDW